MNVLLVEDDELVRSCLQDLLADAGVHVIPACSAAEALRIDEIEAPSVLLADVWLGPGMNGVRLAAEARQRWPGIRCVLMSGDPVAARRASAGTDLCLEKPFRTAELLWALRSEMAR